MCGALCDIPVTSKYLYFEYYDMHEKLAYDKHSRTFIIL